MHVGLLGVARLHHQACRGAVVHEARRRHARERDHVLRRDAVCVEPGEAARRIGDALLIGTVVREPLDPLETGDRLRAGREHLLERRPGLAGRGGEQVAGHEPQRRLPHLLGRETDALPHLRHELGRRLTVGVDVDDHEAAEWCRPATLGKVAAQTRGTAMGFTLTEGHFSTEEEARAEIEARGWHALTIDFDAMDTDQHWHDFDALIYVLDGNVTVELEDGTTMQCGAGARVETPAGVVHRDSITAYRAVIGLAVAPGAMTQPINKEPALLA
jgi:uncharacterized RmlC-like cupin family protein